LNELGGIICIPVFTSLILWLNREVFVEKEDCTDYTYSTRRMFLEVDRTHVVR
jgi:hypothetical protein